MNNNALSQQIMEILVNKFGDHISDFAFPPPVFTAMEGEFVALDMAAGSLTVQFPVRKRYLNPYHAMQGGMVAAAIDNALGPLSVLVAPPNVTRKLELTYSRPVTLDMGCIRVQARLIKRDEPCLYFRAEVRSGDGQRVARAKATHWIIPEPATTSA